MIDTKSKAPPPPPHAHNLPDHANYYQTSTEIINHAVEVARKIRAAGEPHVVDAICEILATSAVAVKRLEERVAQLERERSR